MRQLILYFTVFIVIFLSGCVPISYYIQAINGQLDVWNRRQPVDDWLSNTAIDATLKSRLQRANSLRNYAITELGLPDHGSFRQYADLQRAHAVWAVVATPEFSLQPVSWCFPVVGCLSYRGYFVERDAEVFADTLRETGQDVQINGVPAYSTLGWFADPLLNTFIHWPQGHLAGLIFHEMAHEKLYIADDTTFNESFAESVAQIGVRKWFTENGLVDQMDRYESYLEQKRTFLQLVAETRHTLEQLYASEKSEIEKRTEKKRVIEAMRQSYIIYKGGNTEPMAYDGWFESEINNAKLATVSTYSKWVPAFLALYREQGNDLDRYYTEIQRVSELPIAQREAVLACIGNTEESCNKESPK
ncbi:MAG: aminopeptidase [Magnetococcales bacterium]|nr:aminopeptidase [Magnetococcales bacterium]